MSPFVIFVIVLTIIYIIYYAVMITRDLYGKKEDHKTQEEVFDVSDMVEEEASPFMKATMALAWQIRSTRRLTSMMKTRHLHQQMAKVETQSLKNNHPRTSLRIWLTSLKRRVMRFSPP